MRAILKDLHSLELEDHLEQYRPDDPANFGTWVRLMIGPEDEPGSESFNLLICTPDWLKEELSTRQAL